MSAVVKSLAFLFGLALLGGCSSSSSSRGAPPSTSPTGEDAGSDAATADGIQQGDGGALKLVCPKKAPFDDSVPGLVDQCTHRVLVAGLDAAKIQTSSDDGATWSDPVAIDPAMVDAQLFQIASAFGVVVAYTRGGIYTSTDLKTWTKVAFAAGYNYNGAVHFANGQFVAGGTNGTFASTNGIDWSGYRVGERYPSGVVSGTETHGITFFGGHWILGGATTGNAIVRTSDDGLSWTDSVPAGSQRAGSWAHLASTSSHAVLVGYPGATDNAIAQTADGVTWADRVDATLGLTAAASDGTRFVGVSKTTTLSSTDGTTWTPLATDAPRLDDLVWAEGLWFGMNEVGFYTSPDGVKWKTALTVPAHYLGALGYARVLNP